MSDEIEREPDAPHYEPTVRPPDGVELPPAATGPSWDQPTGGHDAYGDAAGAHFDTAAFAAVSDGSDDDGAQFASHSSRRRRTLAGVSAALAVTVLAAGSIGYVLGSHNGSTRSGAATSPLPGGDDNPGGFGQFPGLGGGLGAGSPSGATTSVPTAVSNSESALVDINTTLRGGQAAAGTGIVMSANGLVLTNNHVIDGATSISVTDLGNNQTYSATVVGYDVKDDVAVIRLQNASGLTVAKMGRPASVGEAVYAVGNAGGTGGTPTVTGGQVTALGQSITASDGLEGTSESLSGLLQVNAQLISGDSGGALTNAHGYVVGMDTASSSSYEGGRGYAIPIATALGIAQKIVAGSGTARIHIGTGAMLGVYVGTASTATNGAPVQSVQPGYPAASAGITAGSRITSVGGVSVTTGSSLHSVMADFEPGQRVTITWVDASGTAHSASVTLVAGTPQ